MSAAPPASGPPRIWVWCLVGFAVWTATALLSAAQTAVFAAYLGRQLDLGRMIGIRLVDWYAGGLALLPFVWLVRHYPLERGRRWRTVGYIAATIVASLAQSAIAVPVA